MADDSNRVMKHLALATLAMSAITIAVSVGVVKGDTTAELTYAKNERQHILDKIKDIEYGVAENKVNAAVIASKLEGLNTRLDKLDDKIDKLIDALSTEKSKGR